MQDTDRARLPSIRLLIQLMLATAFIVFGIYLLFVDSFKLRNIVFTGTSLNLLAITMFSLAGFAVSVLRAWLQGTLPMPPSLSSSATDLSHYRAAVVTRYWPFVVVALVTCVLALLLS